jgi:hypothetical protein
MIAAISARIAVAALCCLLALPASATAACAWVLWTRPTAADRAKLKLDALWRVGGAYETKAECEKQAPPGFDHMCLPDTVKP